MERLNWDSFLRSLTIGSRYGEPVDKPSIDQLNRFEADLRIKLPKSYREFILVFGPGEFSASLEIAAPGYPNLSSPTLDLATANERYRYTPGQSQLFPESDRAVINRLLFFGLMDGKYPLGWDVQDVCHIGEAEYSIFRVGLTAIEKTATSFYQLIIETCDRLFAPNPDWDEEELGPKRVFHPASYG